MELDNIEVVEKVDSWQDAVRLACEPLIKKSLITDQYIESIIKSVYENGPYMVLDDYFALMHARPGDGVNKTSLSLLVTKEEISLESKPVKIFLVLAAEDNKSHLNKLQRIIQIFMDKDKYQIILNGDIEKIQKLFKEE